MAGSSWGTETRRQRCLDGIRKVFALISIRPKVPYSLAGPPFRCLKASESRFGPPYLFSNPIKSERSIDVAVENLAFMSPGSIGRLVIKNRLIRDRKGLSQKSRSVVPSILIRGPESSRPSALRWTSSSLLKGCRAKCSLKEYFGLIWTAGCRVGEDVATLTPRRPGCADFPLPVLHGRASLAAVYWWTIRAAGSG